MRDGCKDYKNVLENIWLRVLLINTKESFLSGNDGVVTYIFDCFSYLEIYTLGVVVFKSYKP